MTINAFAYRLITFKYKRIQRNKEGRLGKACSDRKRGSHGQKPQDQQPFKLWQVLAILLGFLFVQSLLIEGQWVREIPYSQFEQLLDEGRLQDLEVGEERIRGRIVPP